MRPLFVREYGYLVPSRGAAEQERDGATLTCLDFAALKRMALPAEHASRTPSDEPESSPAFRLCAHGGQEALQARNHAGVVLLPSGQCLEILPKLFAVDDAASRGRGRGILLKMLRALPEFPFRSLPDAALAHADLPLLEMFISRFLLETGTLIRKGVCSDYLPTEGEEPFLRGKLLLREHLRRHAAHRDRFYVQHDEFLPDRPENRLVKRALLLALRLSGTDLNRRLARMHLETFQPVPASRRPDADFAACRKDRNLAHYAPVLAWCRLLLRGLSPSPQSGDLRCVSLLFSLPHLFERYVARKLEKEAGRRGWSMRAQASGHFLVEDHHGASLFSLRPDMLFTRAGERRLADTKWKVVEKSGDISQSDMYQMFAYAETYLRDQARKRCCLIYPAVSTPLALPVFHFRREESVLHALAYDLETDACGLPDWLGEDFRP